MIFGHDIDSSIRTFGWSLSGGMDLDNNEYPDLLIGAYESTNAIYLKSAPVVHLDSKVTGNFIQSYYFQNYKASSFTGFFSRAK